MYFSKSKTSSIFSRLKRNFWLEQWNIGVVPRSTDQSTQKFEGDKIQWLLSENKNGFYADPFLVEHNEKLYVFFEKFDNEEQKGVISYCLLQDVGGRLTASEPKMAIAKSFHLSYPFLLKHEDTIFMIPETADANEIAIYKPAHFPDVWIKLKTIVANFPGIDPTVVFWKGKYWLFCTHKKNGESSELHIFFADDIFGTWKPHKKNPVKVDISSSRSAGAFFEREGKLFRYAQDCGRTYGGRLVLNEIERLDEEGFSEKTLKNIEPDFSPIYNQGIHTLNFEGNWAIFDGKRFVGIKKYLNRHVQAAKQIIKQKQKKLL